MSYLSRLVAQSGLRPADAPVGAAAPPPAADRPVAAGDARLEGGAGGQEIDLVVESVVPSRAAPARPWTGPPARPGPPPPVPAVAWTAPEDDAGTSDRAPQPSGQRPVEALAATPLLPRDAPPERAERSAAERPSAPHSAPPAADPVTDQSVIRHDRLLRVVEWLSAEHTPVPEPGPLVTSRSITPSASAVPTSAERGTPAPPSSEPAPAGRASSPPAVRSDEREPPSARAEGAVEVRIDALNLTLEAPVPAVAAEAVVPVPPPPALPPRAPQHLVPPRTTTTDRLRRRYLGV